VVVISGSNDAARCCAECQLLTELHGNRLDPKYEQIARMSWNLIAKTTAEKPKQNPQTKIVF